MVGKLAEVVEKSLEGTPKTTSTGQPVIVDGEQVRDWSPSGANKALETLAKHLGMQVEKHGHTVVGDIVYTLNLDRVLPENERIERLLNSPQNVTISRRNCPIGFDRIADLIAD